jgi:hypothetical protein
MLQAGSVIVFSETLDEPSNVARQSALRKCFESGWLHNEVIEP